MKTLVQELDDIMEDLMVGHNFEYARTALLEWHERNKKNSAIVDQPQSLEAVVLPGPNLGQPIMKGL